MPAKKAAAPPKPTYAVMVAESIKALNDRTGSSVQAISKHVKAQYHIDINKPALVKAIKKGVEAGDLVQIKASYKLNKLKKAPTAAKPKKASTVTTKKKAAPKAALKKVCSFVFVLPLHKWFHSHHCETSLIGVTCVLVLNVHVNN